MTLTSSPVKLRDLVIFYGQNVGARGYAKFGDDTDVCFGIIAQ